MKKSPIVFCIIVFILFVLATSRYQRNYDSLQKEYDDLFDDYVKLETECDNLRKEIDEYEDRYIEVSNQYDTLFDELENNTDYKSLYDKYKKMYDTICSRVSTLYEGYFWDTYEFFDQEPGSNFSKAKDDFERGHSFLFKILDEPD